VRIGDSMLFAALIDQLGIAAVWKRRLSRAFGDRPRLDATIQRLSGGNAAEAPAHAGFLAALDGTDHDAAHRIVADLVSIAGIRGVGGRSAGEIADRFVEQSALGAGGGLDARAQAVRWRFFSFVGKPAAVLGDLKALSAEEKLGIDDTIEGFE